MPRKQSDLLTELAHMPWWVSVTVSAFCYVTLKYIFPAITADSTVLSGLSKGFSNIAHFISLVLLIPVPFSLLNQNRKKELIKTERSLDKIKILDWKSFEDLVGEAFRQTGYSVKDNTVNGADGGVDLWLRKDNKQYIAQCKRWKSQKVGVAVVREMYGIMTSESADGVFIISSGNFTNEALEFADDKPINLINGNDLVTLIEAIDDNSTTDMKTVQELPIKDEPASNNCPRCGGELIKRKAKKGPKAGAEFWGCTSFPKCRYTMNY